MKKKVFFFQYHLPADNNKRGLSDVVIDCQAEWMGSFYDHDPERPVVINSEPIKSRIDNYALLVVKDWYKVFTEIEKIAQDHFRNAPLKIEEVVS